MLVIIQAPHCPRFTYTLKGEEAALLGNVEPESEAEEEQSPAHDSDDSSESDFGLQSGKVANKKKKDKAAKSDAKTAADKTTKDKAPKGKTDKDKTDKTDLATPDSKASSGKVASLDKVKAQATTLSASFQQVDPLQIWLGKAKMKDLEAKVAKAMKAVSALASHPDAEGTAIQEKLSSQAENLSEFLEMVNLWRAQGPQEVNLHDKERWINLTKPLPPDAARAILADIGKKITEAGCHPSSIVLPSSNPWSA